MKIRSLVAAVCALMLGACTPSLADRQAPAPQPTAAPPEATPALAPTAIPIGATSTSAPAPVAPTLAPSPIAEPSAPTATPASPDELAALDQGRPVRDELALARALGVCRATPDACPAVARTTPRAVAVGDLESFFVTDLAASAQYETMAELRYAGPVVLMYVEQGLPYNQADLERAARGFEEQIYPRTRALFGSEPQPGVDGDLRITILNVRLPGGAALGYFSAKDALPRQLNRYSNERQMVLMNLGLLDFASPGYLDTLAHEFQHMIHAQEGPGSAIWFNEGMSQLSQDLNGFLSVSHTGRYLLDTDVQLNHWTTTPGSALSHYGASHLFMRYIYAQYAGENGLRGLIDADAGDNLQAFVELAARTRPDLASFPQLVADWAVANLLDDPALADGRYSYSTAGSLPGLLASRPQPQGIGGGVTQGSVAQFGVDYLALPPGAGELRFQGAPRVLLAAELPRGRYAWWSGRSDESVASLTRAFDLRGLSGATLQFETWYELENLYDYAFVSVSTDGGRTWETLPGRSTTTADPHALNYGHGFTGVSGRPDGTIEADARGMWVEEQVDLSPYAGREILVRFWQATDLAFNGPGILIDNLRVPELGYGDDVEAGEGGWQAEGFVRVDGDLPQLWELRLVRTAPDGAISVEPLPVAPDGSAAASLAPGERGLLVVIAATPHTSERAFYELSLP